MRPGETLTINVNQGDREACVLAVRGERALVEYEMPNGSTSLRVISSTGEGADASDHGHRRRDWQNVSYASISTAWLRAIVEEGAGDWIGRPQQTGRRETPKPAALLEQREHAQQIRIMAGGLDVDQVNQALTYAINQTPAEREAIANALERRPHTEEDGR